MKKLATSIILLIAFGSCEKEPEDLLIGGWKDLPSDFSIAFQEGGLYSWHTSYMADPNSGTGFYHVNGDTLLVEENLYGFDTTYVTLNIFSIGKNDLELRNIETQEVKNYERIKRHRLF
jgi:hypothetical protein